MSKKIIIFLVMLMLFGGVWFVQPKQDKINMVVHQHKDWAHPVNDDTGISNGKLISHIPIITIKTEGNIVPGVNVNDERTLSCDYSIVNNEKGNNSSEDIPEKKGRMEISIRGNSSRIFEKKQYLVKTVDSAGMPKDVSLLGMPKSSSWVLNGSYIDHSMIRNYMLYNISAEIMDYAPKCRMCEVIFTDADGKPQYQGVYTLIEKIEVAKKKVDLQKYDPKRKETSFMVQMNSHIDKHEIRHLKPDDVQAYMWDLEYPNNLDITRQSMEYVEEEILTFEKMLYDAYHTKNWDSVNEAIDINSFVDFYIINEFFQNYDAGTRSTYLYKNLGGKFYLGPVWDFDGTFNNFKLLTFKTDYLELNSTFFYYYLTQNPYFIERCNKRYDELRNSFLSDKYLLQYLDECKVYFKDPAMRNCDRWYDGDYSLYYKDIENMKDFILKRGDWMDKNFKRKSKVVN